MDYMVDIKDWQAIVDDPSAEIMRLRKVLWNGLPDYSQLKQSELEHWFLRFTLIRMVNLAAEAIGMFHTVWREREDESQLDELGKRIREHHRWQYLGQRDVALGIIRNIHEGLKELEDKQGVRERTRATKYVRTRRGKVVHLATCYLAVRAQVSWNWEWAEDKARDEIFAKVAELGYHCCGKCKPLEVTK
jgi:hypothetical protein